ncbi:hypothetical protein K438DRAFT_1787955 [Mycena galopus ATCC 62051]|nr:hypothetical protein K438DRAFT_1787955 [Mycena galopus ATCC 62051]
MQSAAGGAVWTHDHGWAQQFYAKTVNSDKNSGDFDLLATKCVALSSHRALAVVACTRACNSGHDRTGGRVSRFSTCGCGGELQGSANAQAGDDDPNLQEAAKVKEKKGVAEKGTDRGRLERSSRPNMEESARILAALADLLVASSGQLQNEEQQVVLMAENRAHHLTFSDVPAWARPESPGLGLGLALKTLKPSPSQAPKSPGFCPSRSFWLVNFRKWGPGLAKFQAEPEPNLSEAGPSRAQAKKPGLRGLRPKPEHHYLHSTSSFDLGSIPNFRVPMTIADLITQIPTTIISISKFAVSTPDTLQWCRYMSPSFADGCPGT